MKQAASRNPWSFVPSLYFAEGLPYVIVNTVSVILYKKMGIDNAAIAFWTSWLYLPWVIKMFWGPLVDMYGTKRRWVLVTQALMALCMFFAAYAVSKPVFFFFSLAALVVAAFISATYDIATDGFYMLVLSGKEQAMFVGLRSGFYRLAMIFGSGILVLLAGMIETSTGNIPFSWTVALGITGILFFLAFLYHTFVLPFPSSDSRHLTAQRTGSISFQTIVSAYFRQQRVGVLIAFILLYRLGEAMLLKLVTPFLLDAHQAGGLGLSTSQVGLAYGTVGIICLVLGGILGGWFIARYGLRRCVWPMVLAMHLPDLFFVYMAYTQPPVAFAYPLIALEQFGYGLGFTVFTVYLMYSADGQYKTSHFAISTGIMALGMMVPGFVSGWLQQQVGYTTFFVIVCFLTIPGMLTIPFLPKREA
ncbi:MAG: MFS transporter [bacterium]